MSGSWSVSLLLIAGLAAPLPAAAATYTWVGPTGGAWNVAANWSPSTGFPNGASDKAIVNGGASALAIAIPGGPSGTPITLQQLQVNGSTGAIAIVGVSSSLTLVPLAGQPAIDYTGAGGLEINTPIVLNGDATVRVGAASTLTFLKSISETGSARAFQKQGFGTARFNSGSANTHTGTTIVEEGGLILMQPNTIVDTAAVEVRANGVLTTLRGETIGALTVNEGIVDVSAATDGFLGVSSLHMIGGSIRSGVGGLRLYLFGNVTATSTPTQIPAAIEASIGVELFDATRTFTVLDGPANVDMEIRGGIHAVNQPATVGLIKDGPGILSFPNFGAANDYQGVTWVKEGRLHAARKVSNGDLRIGDGAGGPAEFGALANELILDTKSITVEADGVYPLSDHAETVDQLTVNGGTVFLSGIGGAVVNVRGLAMTGGTIEAAMGFVQSAVIVRNVANARIDATSTATQTATIRGDGLLVLEARPDVSVNNGPQAIDLSIDVKTIANLGLKKSGPGVARFTKDTGTTGGFEVEAGTLLIDGQQSGNNITVHAATLGGIGFVGSVVATTGATIAPGASPGVLRAKSLQLAAGATFAAELNGTTAGTGYDQLRVGATVSLSNATLGIAIGTGVTFPANTAFTILDNDGTDAIVGTFANLAEGATAIADRHAFRVSYVGGDGNDIVLTVLAATEPPPPPPPNAVTYYLAEGATGGFFDEDVAIANPTDTDAPVTLTFLQEGGGTVVEHRTVPKQARLTVHVDSIAGLENASPSVQVESDQKVPLIVERSMFWDGGYYGGHTANAVAKPETKWILAEGFQGFFDTYLLIANANATETTATVTFLRENESPVVKTIPIAAFARKTIYAGEFSELIGRAFGMVVEATQPVIAERSMYFASIPGRLWTGGHVNTGVTAPSTSWFHAEGATGGFFSTFILLSNPQTTDAHVDLRFLLEDGTSIVKSKTLPAGQRLTVNPAAEGEPRLENAALSTIVASDVPIVSERSMYWPGDATPFGEGHNSSGVVATATRWGLAEGRVGAPRNFTTYILLANPTTTAADVTVTYLREAGAPITKTYTVPPTSRFNIDVAGAVPELHDESFGARIEVTNSVAIAVERSLYWDANGIFWAGGTNALATPLP